MTFDEWLESMGIRRVDPEEGAPYWIAPDGQRYTKQDPEYNQMYAAWMGQKTDWAGNNIWGSAGLPDERTMTFVGADGKTYARIGDPREEGKLAEGFSYADMFYDPTYGWAIDQNALPEETWQEKLSSMMPVFSAMAMFVAPIAASLGAASGAATAGLGGLESAVSEFGGSLATGAYEAGTIANALAAGGTYVTPEVAQQIAQAVSYGMPIDQAVAQYAGDTGSQYQIPMSDTGTGTEMGPFQDVVSNDWFPQITDDAGNVIAGGTGSVTGPSDLINYVLPGSSLIPGGIMGPLQTAGTIAGAGGAIANAAGNNTGAMDQGIGTNAVRDSFVDTSLGVNPTGNGITDLLGNANWGQIIPALLGGAAGAATTPGDYTQTTTSTTDVPERYRPYMDALINAAVPYFQQYVGTNPDEQAAMQMIRDQVAAGNPMMDAANANLEATLRGDYLNSPIQDYLTQQFANYETPDLDYLRNAASGAYLNSNPAQDWLMKQMLDYEVPDTAGLRDTASGMYLSPDSNPWLQATYDRAARQVSDNYLNTTQPRTDAMFNRASAFGPGNSAYTEIVARNQYGLGENLGNLATDIYGGNYQTERNRQFAAQGQLPQLGLAGQAARMGAANAYSQNYANERGLQQAAGMALPMYGNQAANIRLGAAGQYGQNYNAERARQQAATAFAPTLSQSRFDDAMRLYELGNMWRQPTMNTFNWGSGLLRGSGSQSTSSTPQYSNPLAGILGGMFVGSQFSRGLFGN